MVDHKVRPCNNQVPDRNRRRQHHGPNRVFKTHAVYQKVIGNHAAVEEHREGKQHHNLLAPQQLLAGERIGGRHRQAYVKAGANDRVYDGVFVTRPYLRVVEDADIPIHHHVLRQKDDVSGIDLRGVAEGGDHHKIQGIGAQDQHHGHQRVDENVEHPVAPRKLHLIFCCFAHAFNHPLQTACHHSPLSVVLRDIQLTSSTITQQMTALNIPMAVE